MDPSDAQAKAFRLTDDGGLELSQALRNEWIEKSVDIRALRQANLLHGKMYKYNEPSVDEGLLATATRALHPEDRRDLLSAIPADANPVFLRYLGDDGRCGGRNRPMTRR